MTPNDAIGYAIAAAIFAIFVSPYVILGILLVLAWVDRGE